MALADLLKDARLVSTSTDADLRGLTADFLRRRVRHLVVLNPANADPARPGDITPAATIALGNVIARELPKVIVASDTILARIARDTAHLSLDPAIRRKRGTRLPPLPLKDARANRRRLVRAIVYQAAAADITLAEPPQIERLHRLVDRRLRIVERMVYDIGRTGVRAWNTRHIASHRGGPWPDGFERIFEYPRVPRWAFLDVCFPDENRICRAPMDDWGHPGGSVWLHAHIRTNPLAAPSWIRDVERFDYAPNGGANAVTAIQRLFQPSTDFRSRNLMLCDQTIHALQLEALELSRTKRGEGPAWLQNEVAAQAQGWLRIHVPIGRPGRYLAGDGEPLLFEHTVVREADLQVGDHLIIYNHPAYSHATHSGVWQLENAIVVQTFPTLLMQGHGSALRTKGGMWDDMIALFHGEMRQRRADVAGLCRVLGFGPNTVTVNDLRYVGRGMKIDIVRDDPSETVLASNRVIVSIVGRTIRYTGASVSATTPHRLRRARTKLFDDTFEGIDDAFKVARRVAPAASQYEPALQKADWFIAWIAKERDEAIRKDTARAAFVKAQQLIEYTQERIGTKTQTIGWFPLWKPSTVRGVPRRRNGKISAIEEVTIKPEHVAGWTWFFDADPAKRDRVAVIRPREL